MNADNVIPAESAGSMRGLSTPVSRVSRAFERCADVLDRRAGFAYGLIIACFVALFALAAWRFTVEVDEAQILISAAQAFGVAVPVTINYGKPTLTTGGAYLLVNGLLAHVTTDIVAHRLVSLVAAAGLIVGVYRLLRSLGQPVRRAMVGVALFSATPAFIMVASLAMGEVIATLFLIGGAVHWMRQGTRSWSAAAVTGILLGTACATRPSCLAALPGFIVYTILVPERNFERVGKALFVAAVAAVVCAASIAAYYLSSLAIVSSDAGGYLVATGLDASKPLGRMLRSIRILNEHLPFFVLAGIIGAWATARFAAGPSRPTATTPDLAGLLLFMGLAMLGAWLLIAPIPHVRYLWPALPCIWLCGVILLLDLWRAAGSVAFRLTMHAIVLSGAGYALIAGLVLVANGESLTVAYQAMGVSPRIGPSPGKRFRAGADQRNLAQFVETRPSSSRFFMQTIAFGFPIAYLSHRPVQPIGDLSASGDRFVLLSPPDYTIAHPEPLFSEWLRRYTRLAYRSGDYAAFEVSADAPLPPQGRYMLGMNDFFEEQLDRCAQCRPAAAGGTALPR